MKVLCAGLAVCDILVKPVTPDSLASDTTAVEQIVLAGGGDAYNVACNLAAMGVGVSLVTRVGDDELGGWLLNQARSRSIADGIIVRRDARTSASIVAIHPDGERSFFSYKGACHAMTPEDVTDRRLSGYDVFYLGSAFDLPGIDNATAGLATLFERAKTHGLFTVLDVTTDLTPAHMDTLRPALPHLSLFIPSQGQALGLTGTSDPEQAARRFRELGCETVVVKLGPAGCLILTGNHCVRLPAYRAEVVDTTGAGDAFVSGYLAAHTRGLPPIACARHGNAAGAVAVGAIGANGALKNFQQLVRIVNLGVFATPGIGNVT